MLNFMSCEDNYRSRIRWATEELVDALVKNHLMNGGTFDSLRFTKFYNDATMTAQLLVDLGISSGLSPLEVDPDDEAPNNQTTTPEQTKNAIPANAFVSDHNGNDTGALVSDNRKFLAFSSDEDSVSDFETRDSEGLSGSDRDSGGVSRTKREPDTLDDNRSAGGGKEHAPQFKPHRVESGPGKGRGHSGGPPSPEVHTPTGDESDGAGPSVPDVCG